MNKEARNYLADAMALRRASQRHKRLDWHDSARHLWIEAKARLGMARVWHEKECENGTEAMPFLRRETTESKEVR